MIPSMLTSLINTNCCGLNHAPSETEALAAGALEVDRWGHVVFTETITGDMWPSQRRLRQMRPRGCPSHISGETRAQSTQRDARLGHGEMPAVCKAGRHVLEETTLPTH